MRAPELLDVPVAGATLRVARWQGTPGAPVVIAAHGITATHAGWYRIADALGDAVTLITPDLRGRGESRTAGEPYGLRVHADDLVAILDHFGVERATFVGHSMGGFVVPIAGRRHPSRVESIVVLDGGIRILEPPEGMSVEEITTSVIGPSLERLKMTFPSREAYNEFWRPHPGLTADGWNEYVQAYVDYDLVAEGDHFRSGVSLDAVLADATDTLIDEDSTTAIFGTTHPLTFLRAARGVMNDAPLYAPEAMDRLHAAVPHAQIETVDTSHFLLVLGNAATVVAERIRKAAGA